MRSIYNIPVFARPGITGLLWGEFGFDPVSEAVFLVLLVVAFLAAADSLGSWASGFSFWSAAAAARVVCKCWTQQAPSSHQMHRNSLILFSSCSNDAKLCFKTVVINCCCVLRRSSSSKECCAGGGGGLAPLLLVWSKVRRLHRPKKNNSNPKCLLSCTGPLVKP